jgi:hypothetical protein
VEGEHPDRAKHFAVRRVEPGEELGRDEVEVDRVAGLEEAGREGAVVPGGVETGHAGAEAQLHAADEVADRDPGDQQGDDGGPKGRSVTGR